MEKLYDQNVGGYRPILTPAELKRRYPLSDYAVDTIRNARHAIRDILDGRSARTMIVVGPCSIHNVGEAEEYADRLARLSSQVDDALLLVMRAYFEKPRTTVGWKGLINDPHLDGTFDIETGLLQARKLLRHLAEAGVPAATEALDPITYQYLSDLISWASIGARTVESQTHREMASGITAPVGFKNNIQGNVDAAVYAVGAARRPQCFLGIDQDAKGAIVITRGNAYGHIVLRGGERPNYDRESVAGALKKLAGDGLRERLLVDCSHGNSRKEYRNQPAVFRDVLSQIAEGNTKVIGMMLESNLEEGRQDAGGALRRGVSITDACIGWSTTEELVLESYNRLKSEASKL